MNILIPMAGKGNRFKEVGYTDSKPFIDVNGKPMIHRVIENLNITFSNDYKRIFVCLRDDYEKYDLENHFKEYFGDITFDLVVLDELTEGAAQSVLAAKKLINNYEPLLIVNSDQMIDYDPETSFEILNRYDGGLLCFFGDSNEWSYAKKSNEGFVLEVAEKKRISQYATAGYYYWKRGGDFVKYAEQMIESNDKTNNEYYVAPVYNYAINDGLFFNIEMVDNIYELGTPEWLENYLKYH